MKSKKDFEYFENLKPDLGLVVGWNRLIPSDIIKTFKYGMLGLHGTPYGLPKGRGRSPVIWTLVLGEKKYYYYLFEITENIDDGPIYSEKIIDITEFDDNSTFYKKLVVLGSEQLNAVVPKIFDYSIKPFSQPDGKATYFPKRGFKDGEIDWSKSTIDIYNIIRAITSPYPCAHTYLNGQIFHIIKAIPFSKKLFIAKNPGDICILYEDGEFVAKTGDGTLLVKKYIPAEKLVNVKSFDKR